MTFDKVYSKFHMSNQKCTCPQRTNMEECNVFLGAGGDINFEGVLKNFWGDPALEHSLITKKKGIYEDYFVYDDSRFTGILK